MNKRLVEKIEMKVAEIWHTNEYPYDPDNIKVEIAENGSYVDITISSMYQSPGCTFAQMQALSDYFGTTEIGIAETFGYTCDDGSSYGFTLRIGKPKRGTK